MTARRFVLAEIPEQPWRNGGGTTREILSVPPEAGIDRFSWRVSAATIAANGPFSAYPGVERTIMLLRGGGVWLRSARLDHRLDVPGVPFVFDGDETVDCTLLGGPCLVLNIMARRGQGSARLGFVTGPVTVAADYGMLLGLGGAWQIGSELVRSGEGLWWAERPQRWRIEPVQPPGRLASLRWDPT